MARAAQIGTYRQENRDLDTNLTIFLNESLERAASCAMARLDGFAQGPGLDEAITRGIFERMAADMLDEPDEERLAEARSRMIVASA